MERCGRSGCARVGVVLALAAVDDGRQRVHDAGVVLANSGEDFLLADEQTGAGSRLEGDRWVSRLEIGGDRPPVHRPRPPAAVEYRGVIEAESSQHPPHPGSPRVDVGVVEDDPGAVADAQFAHHGAELAGRREHEGERRRRVRNLVNEVDMGRPEDMVLLPLRPAGPVLTPTVGQHLHDHRAVEYPQVGRTQLFLQPSATDELIHRNLHPSHPRQTLSAAGERLSLGPPPPRRPVWK